MMSADPGLGRARRDLAVAVVRGRAGRYRLGAEEQQPQYSSDSQHRPRGKEPKADTAALTGRFRRAVLHRRHLTALTTYRFMAPLGYAVVTVLIVLMDSDLSRAKRKKSS